MPRKGENIYERKDKRWEARYISGRGPDGQARYTSLYGRSYEEVRQKRNAALALSYAQNRRPVCRLSVEALCVQWLEQARCTVKESTYYRYAHMIQKHILPELGKLKAEKLTANVLRGFLSRKQASGRLDGHGGLSPKTVQDLAVLIKSIMRLAAQEYDLPDHTQTVRPPKVEPPEIEVFNEVETARLEQYLRDAADNSSAGLRLCLRLGLRLGEVCALKWSDVDWVRGTVYIHKTIQRVNRAAEGTGPRTCMIMTSPKTKQAVREIPLMPDLLAYLRRVGQGQSPDAFLATGRRQPMDPRTYQYRFQSVLKKLDLRHISFHTLRHTFATLCIRQGMNMKALSAILGHASVQLTLNRYVHMSVDSARQQLAQLDFSAQLPANC